MATNARFEESVPQMERAQTEIAAASTHDAVMRIPVTMQVVIGAATMPVSDLMTLGRGAVVSLDQRVGDPVDVVVNGRVIARGDVVVVEEDGSRFGVALTEIVGQGARD